MSDLFAKIAAAQAELGDLPRDRTVNAGSYSYAYVTEDAITRALRRILSPKGVAVFVSWTSAERDGNLTTVTGEVTFVDESDRFVVGIIGMGADPGDKGINKAQTSALRMGLCKTFLQAGDDDGEDAREPREGARQKASTRVKQPVAAPATITDAQRRKLWASAKSAGLDEAGLRVLVARHREGNESTKDMPRNVFDVLLAEIEGLENVAAVQMRSAAAGSGDIPVTGVGGDAPDPQSPPAVDPPRAAPAGVDEEAASTPAGEQTILDAVAAEFDATREPDEAPSAKLARAQRKGST